VAGGGGRSGSPSLGGWLVAMGTGEECEATSAGPQANGYGLGVGGAWVGSGRNSQTD
jgi:hypothetical protein